MPVIVDSNKQHPFLPSVGNPSAIDEIRAKKQDVRVLEIAVVNLMADKQATERQLATWLGDLPLQIQLTFVATDSYVQGVRAGRETKNTPSDHIRDFYSAWSEIKDRKFDGIVITGVNALKPRVSEEVIWPEVTQILDWSKTHALSSLFLCWGAQAALQHFHGIESRRSDQKTFGLLEHHIVSDKSGLLRQLPDIFPVPVSRWKGQSKDDIRKCAVLEVLAESEAGYDMLAETAPYDDGAALYPTRLYILNHPEYDTDTLKREYERDRALDPATPLPKHYFPGDDPAQPVRNTWRHTAAIYSNWIDLLYKATPYDIRKVPQPFRRQDTLPGLAPG